MFGRCAECVTNYPIITWGAYGGKPAKQVSKIPEEERDYTGMTEQDRELLSRLDRDMCRRCEDVRSAQPLISGVCWCCFQTGHVSLSSGKYSGQPAMLVASKYEDYEGDDLTREDLYLLSVAQYELDYHEESSKQLCEFGPCTGMTFEEVACGDWSWYKSRPRRNLSLLVFCATTQLLKTGVPSNHL